MLQWNTGPTNRWSVGASFETLKDPIGSPCRRIGRIVDRCSTGRVAAATAASLGAVLVQTGSTVKHFRCRRRRVNVPSPLGTFNPATSRSCRTTGRMMVMMAGTTVMMTMIVIWSCRHPQTPILCCLVQSAGQVAELASFSSVRPARGSLTCTGASHVQRMRSYGGRSCHHHGRLDGASGRAIGSRPCRRWFMELALVISHCNKKKKDNEGRQAVKISGQQSSSSIFCMYGLFVVIHSIRTTQAMDVLGTIVRRKEPMLVACRRRMCTNKDSIHPIPSNSIHNPSTHNNHSNAINDERLNTNSYLVTD